MPKEMADFQATVHKIAPPGMTNSVAIATILLPPKLVEFELNRFGDIVELNHGIKVLNQGQPQENFPVRYAPQFHTWGLASRKGGNKHPRNLLECLPRHRPGQWREYYPEDMLHLCDGARLRMGKACINYFLALYSMTQSYAASKPRALALDKKIKKADKNKQGRVRKIQKKKTTFMTDDERAKKKLICAQMTELSNRIKAQTAKA